MGLSDLLKMLDPRTASTVKSRYYNKVLECKLIIITTTLPMENFFHQVFENEKEPLKQLERRCGTVLHMTKDEMIMSVYQPGDGKYRQLAPLPNTILSRLDLRNHSEDELLEMQAKITGLAVDEIKRMRAAGAHKPANCVEHALDLFDGTVVH